MAVRIRLKKMGRKHRPFFRICAMDSRAPRDGRVIEELGTYDPMVPETDARALLKAERIDYWMGVGAKPTPKVGVLIRKYGTGGSHLEQQQSALERLAARKGNAIAAATKAAEQAAKAAPPPKAEETPAPAAEAEAAAPADDAAAEEAKSDEAATEEATTEESAGDDSGEASE